jgi:hypothetical protein
MYCISISDKNNFESILLSYRQSVLSKTSGNNIHYVLEWVGKVDNLVKSFFVDMQDMTILFEAKRYITAIDEETGVHLSIKD